MTDKPLKHPKRIIGVSIFGMFLAVCNPAPFPRGMIVFLVAYTAFALTAGYAYRDLEQQRRDIPVLTA